MSSDVENEAKNIFSLYHTENQSQNQVDGKFLGEMLRAVGMAPTDADETRTHPISRDEFIRMVSDGSNTGEHSAHSELAAAFGMFDTAQTGQIGINNMRNILCNLGDRLTAEDVEVVVNRMKEMGRPGPEGDIEVSINSFTAMILKEK